MPFMPEDKAAKERIEGLLAKKGIDPNKDKVIGLGLGASCPSKIWRPEYFASLGLRLKEKKVKIIVLAQEKERHLTDEFKQGFGDDFCDLTGKLSLPEIFSLFRRLHLFIGNDSGLIHLCWAVATPVISLFGRKNPGLSPKRWAPLGKDSFFFHGDVDCLSCSAHNCGKQHRCLDAVKPAEVLDKALEILNR
jgi:heptosyltransferase-2